MITTTVTVALTCDRCGDGLTGDPDWPAGTPAAFPDRLAVLAALERAVVPGGWSRHLDGRLLCPTCSDRAACLGHGHRFPNPAEDVTEGWRLCACARSIPSHTAAPSDPAGGAGCGMQWRLCGRCDHIDERPAADTTDQHDGHEHVTETDMTGSIR